MFAAAGVRVVEPGDASAGVLVNSRSTWARVRDDRAAADELGAALERGTSAGPQPLGVGYATGRARGGPLESVPSVGRPQVLEDVQLFGGVRASFVETAAPESCVQQPLDDRSLWAGIPREATWLWNGLRGGLIVPAADMQVTGLSGDAVLALWRERGADPTAVAQGRCYAYELAGQYAFAERADDKAVSEELTAHVRFMVEDAPALENVVNPNAPVTVSDVGALYRGSGATAGVPAGAPGRPARAGVRRGRGHFDSSDRLADSLATFVRKAAEARLPTELPLVGTAPKLRPVDARDGGWSTAPPAADAHADPAAVEVPGAGDGGRVAVGCARHRCGRTAEPVTRSFSITADE